MGSYEALKTAITTTIKQNGNAEITGDLLQQVLLAIVSNIGKGATFAGFATPSTNPGTPDNYVFYLAAKNGTYSNFGGIVLENQLAAFSNKSGEWQADVVDLVTADALDALQTTLQGEIDAEKARAIARENAIEAMFSGDVEEAVNAWLEAHPEATTTVLDNSITLNKLNTEVRQYIGYAKNVLEYPGENFEQKLRAALADDTSETRFFFIPPGEYEINDTITHTGLPFKLMGLRQEGGVFIKCIDCGFIELVNTQNVEICDIALQGTGQGAAIIDNGTFTNLHTLAIGNFFIAIEADDANKGLITNTQIEQCSASIVLYQTTSYILRENAIFESMGIIIYNSYEIVIRDSNIDTIGGYGFDVSLSQNVIITGCSAQGIVWIMCQNSHGVIVDNLTHDIHGTSRVVDLDGGNLKISGKFNLYHARIEVKNNGILDLTGAIIDTPGKQINNNGGYIIANPAQYMVGYTLQQDTEDDTCPVTFNGLLIGTEEYNYAGQKVYGLNSKYATGSTDVDRYSPGIKYHFKVPIGYKYKRMYLSLGTRTTPTTDTLLVAFVGAKPISMRYGWEYVEEAENYTIIKLTSFMDLRAIMLEVTSNTGDIYTTIYHLPLDNPRSTKFIVDFIYISEDNRILIPPEWKPENRTSGTTAQRPLEAKDPGFVYYDTTINKPIYWNGAEWKDAMGNNV